MTDLKLVENLELDYFNGEHARFANGVTRLSIDGESWKYAGKPVTVTIIVEKNS